MTASSRSGEPETVCAVLATLMDQLDSRVVDGADIIPWSCPVPAFGDLSSAHVATVGINPSNREFVDECGNELQWELRRFHTLRSLGLESWSDADARHLEIVLDTYRSYFSCNPYDAWFKRLDFVLRGTKMSYYDPSRSACHLDLIPYATVRKWTSLTTQQRSILLSLGRSTLGILLRDSSVRVLILNGTSVVKNFQHIARLELQRREMPSWSLRRKGRRNVVGVAYMGTVHDVAGVSLDRELKVLGFNHNIQSSFGVTREVTSSIRDWIGRTAEVTG